MADQNVLDEPHRRPITGRDRFRILQRDNFTCQYCGRSAPDVVLEVDHYYPESRRGVNNDWNLKAACKECNRGKAATVIDPEYIRPSDFMDVVRGILRHADRVGVDTVSENLTRLAARHVQFQAFYGDLWEYLGGLDNIADYRNIGDEKLR